MRPRRSIILCFSFIYHRYSVYRSEPFFCCLSIIQFSSPSLNDSFFPHSQSSGELANNNATVRRHWIVGIAFLLPMRVLVLLLANPTIRAAITSMILYSWFRRHTHFFCQEEEKRRVARKWYKCIAIFTSHVGCLGWQEKCVLLNDLKLNTFISVLVRKAIHFRWFSAIW